MTHNYQLRKYGTCRCKCHKEENPLSGDKCPCGWLNIFPSEKRIILRSGKLTSRVVPFRKNKPAGRWNGATRISITSAHNFHQPTLRR